MGFIECGVFGGVVENLDACVRRTRYLDMHHPLVVARHSRRAEEAGDRRCMDLQAVCCLRDFRIPTFSNTLKTARLRKLYTRHTRTRRWLAAAVSCWDGLHPAKNMSKAITKNPSTPRRKTEKRGCMIMRIMVRQTDVKSRSKRSILQRSCVPWWRSDKYLPSMYSTSSRHGLFWAGLRN